MHILIWKIVIKQSSIFSIMTNIFPENKNHKQKPWAVTGEVVSRGLKLGSWKGEAALRKDTKSIICLSQTWPSWASHKESPVLKGRGPGS